ITPGLLSSLFLSKGIALPGRLRISAPFGRSAKRRASERVWLRLSSRTLEEAFVALADTLLLVGTTIADKYAVERVVGEGGFAVVYRAMHTTWKRPVALKVFK